MYSDTLNSRGASADLTADDAAGVRDRDGLHVALSLTSEDSLHVGTQGSSCFRAPRAARFRCCGHSVVRFVGDAGEFWRGARISIGSDLVWLVVTMLPNGQRWRARIRFPRHGMPEVQNE